MASSGCDSAWRPKSSRLLTTPSLFAPMSTRISSLSMRTTVPSTTSPCLKLLMSESCSASSSSIVVGSGPARRAGSTGASSSARRPRRAALGCLVLGLRPTSAAAVSAPRPRRASAVGCLVRGGRLGASAAAGPPRGRVGLGVAGSSATAMVATVSSDAGSATEAAASGSGAVPPCCSSVKVVVSPGRGFRPENHERPPSSRRGRLGGSGPW